MTVHIDCTTPEKLEAFCDALLTASKGNQPVDLAKVAAAANTKQLIAGKIEFWHGLKVGQCVICRYQTSKIGHIEDVIVNQVRHQTPFGTLLCRWNDGTSTEEHPEYLTKTIQQ